MQKKNIQNKPWLFFGPAHGKLHGSHEPKKPKLRGHVGWDNGLNAVTSQWAGQPLAKLVENNGGALADIALRGRGAISPSPLGHCHLKTKVVCKAKAAHPPSPMDEIGDGRVFIEWQATVGCVVIEGVGVLVNIHFARQQSLLVQNYGCF